MFEDRSSISKPFFLDIGNVSKNFSVTFTFLLEPLNIEDKNSASGIQILDGIETFGKDKRGHFLVLYTTEGNLEVKRWNGLYYSIVQRKVLFNFKPKRERTMKIEVTEKGVIKVYLDKKLYLTVRTKLNVNKETPLRLCAFPGINLQILKLEID